MWTCQTRAARNILNGLILVHRMLWNSLPLISCLIGWGGSTGFHASCSGQYGHQRRDSLLLRLLHEKSGRIQSGLDGSHSLSNLLTR
jgi:hypothetical protein